MQLHALAGALSFCIFSLGLFLGAGVRPLLIAAMKSEPALIGPILTRMFSRYNVLTLALSILSLLLEIMSTRTPARLSLAAALVAILALKLPFDKAIQRREGAAQIRGAGEEGKRLDLLHGLMEKATFAVLALSLALFVLALLR